MIVFFHLTLCWWVCFKLYCQHIWTTEAAVWWHNPPKVPPRGQMCFSERSLPLFPHPPFLSFARPSSGLHRGECVWDGVAVRPMGKQRFSLASKTSSRLLRVVPNVTKLELGRLFSPRSTACKQEVIFYKPDIQKRWHLCLWLMLLA